MFGAQTEMWEGDGFHEPIGCSPCRCVGWNREWKMGLDPRQDDGHGHNSGANHDWAVVEIRVMAEVGSLGKTLKIFSLSRAFSNLENGAWGSLSFPDFKPVIT
ncbi:hypothetical protein V6N11_016780 [Hibiscus sabdariffa]|uniref:Uncharacterized protein n=1 Tax=Hibiscus sabdariffa TaxID=183260 RepID=A0ABR2TWG2_9ROSI